MTTSRETLKCSLWNPWCLIKNLYSSALLPLKDSVWPIVRTFMILVLLILIALLVIYIVYHSLHKHKIINHFYGRIAIPSIVNQNGPRWCILAMTKVHKRSLMGKVIEIITIELETKLPPTAVVHTPTNCLCWNVTSFDLQLLATLVLTYHADHKQSNK